MLLLVICWLGLGFFCLTVFVPAPCRPELVLTVLDGIDVRIPRNVSHFLSEQQHARFLECRYRDARNFLQVKMLIKYEAEHHEMT